MNATDSLAVSASLLNKYGIAFGRMMAKTVGPVHCQQRHVGDRVIVSVFGLTLPDPRLDLVDAACNDFSIYYYR